MSNTPFFIQTHILIAKAMLQEINQIELVSSFSTGESILQSIKNSPRWEWGDDFNECLESVSINRP